MSNQVLIDWQPEHVALRKTRGDSIARRNLHRPLAEGKGDQSAANASLAAGIGSAAVAGLKMTGRRDV